MNGLTLDITLPKCTTEELGFLIHWSGLRATQFPHFGQWVCTLATDELARRMNPGSEASMIPLPGDLKGAKGACFLLGSHTLSRLALTAGVAVFADDLERKIVCDVAGYLEASEFAASSVVRSVVFPTGGKV